MDKPNNILEELLSWVQNEEKEEVGNNLYMALDYIVEKRKENKIFFDNMIAEAEKY